MVRKENPYHGMIDQRFQRTYLDCREFGATDPCCPDCLDGKETMLDAPVLKRIYVKPPNERNDNVDWALNIEGVLCCHHHHLSFITREAWLKLVEKNGARPYFIGTEARYTLDDSGGHTTVFSRAASPKPKTPKAQPQLSSEPRVKMRTCSYHGDEYPIYGKCPTCFPNG